MIMTRLGYRHPAVAREAKLIYGKGWSISEAPRTTPNSAQRYNAIALLPGRKRIALGARDTREEAALLAVRGARHYGTLDWIKTVRWFKLFDYQLASEDTFGFEPTPRGKGWYVRQYITRAKNKIFIAAVGHEYHVDGKRKHKMVAVCSRKSRRLAVEHAIRAAKDTEHYNEAATILWLERNGMDDLTKLARISA